jgi:hypothetical protein
MCGGGKGGGVVIFVLVLVEEKTAHFLTSSMNQAWQSGGEEMFILKPRLLNLCLSD